MVSWLFHVRTSSERCCESVSSDLVAENCLELGRPIASQRGRESMCLSFLSLRTYMDLGS